MINLFTIPEDRTTDRVIEYIRYFSNDKIQRINNNESFSDLTIKFGDKNTLIELISKKGKSVKIHEGKKDRGWYRRGSIAFELPVNEKSLNDKTSKHLFQEIEYLRDFIYSYSLDIGSHFKEFSNNRIQNFLFAEESGLKIPSSIITTSKKELLFFKKKYSRIITKPIHNGHLYFEQDNKQYNCVGTVLLDDNTISNLDNFFCPSLFQEYIEKEVELRIFIVNKKMYPMAIFSQLDDQTKYDFRNYNKSRPSRNVPFKIKKEIQEKLTKFMDKVGLNTGSIDLILTPENEYYFLEVNPTGQFGWVSADCNYYITREIAKILLYD